MKLKLDESLSRYLKPALISAGHDVATTADEGLLSQPDPTVAQAAATEDRMLLSLDLEFADLRKYPPGSHPGVILFRPATFSALAVNRFVEEFVRDADLTEFARCVVIVEPHRVRVRRPPLDTEGEGWTEIRL